MIEGILHHEPQWELLPAQTPPAVRALLRRCLAKDPQERYRHIGDVRLDLRDAMAARAWEMRRDNAAGAGRLWTWLAAAACVVAVASVSIGIAAWRRPAQVSQAAAAQRFDVLFPENALQRDLERVQLALSPDGRSIVVACQTPTFGQSLWSRSHADGRWRRLEQTEGGHRPVISPDGQWIAFFRDGHIYKRRLTGGGGDPIRLASSTNWYGLSWTSDGQHIVYATAWGDPIVAMHDSPNAPAQIISQVMTDRGEVTHVGPVCVPGSPWVLYNAWAGGEESSVYAVNRLTRQQHFVLSNASSARIAITPRGDYILFERASSIFAAPFDRATGKVIGPEAVVVDGVMNDGTRFSAYFDVAADGTLAYIPGTSFTEQSRLAFVNENGTIAAFNDDRTSLCEPAFSIDGRRLAVIIKGKLYRVLIYDLERQTGEYVVTGGDTVSVAISPDGSTIACTVNRDGGYGIDLFSLKHHRRLRRIVPPGPDYPSDLHWSADGKFITFTMSPAENAPRDIWLVEPTDDPKPRPLVTSSAADFHASPSPDGKWLAYTSDISGRREVYLVAFDRGTTRQITSGGGESPAWSPDGRALFYIAPNGLVSVGITPEGVVAGRPIVVHDKPFGQSDPIARNYTVAPDGRPLIVERSESAPTVSHVNVITNWWALLPGGGVQKPGS